MGLAPAMPHSSSHSGGDGIPPGELVWRYLGASPRRMMALPRRCQGINARVREQAHACGAPSSEADPVRGERTLERGGPRSRGERALERGGACSR
jgi:hypothetical protein